MSSYLEEAKELEKRWGQSKIMSGISDSLRKQMIKTLLDNQAAMNANPSSVDPSQMKRIKIPLVRRITPSLEPILNEETGASKKKKKPVFRNLDDEWES